MAEQVIWNKKLLIASLVLGVLAVGLFYIHDSYQEKRIRGKIVRVLKWRDDLKEGQKVTKDNVEVTEFSAGISSLEGVAREAHLDNLIDGGTLSRDVEQNRFVFVSEIYRTGAFRPSAGIKDRYRLFALKVDPDSTPGSLSVGDRVDLHGVVRIGGKQKTEKLIEYLRVLEVNGRAKNPEAANDDSRRPGGTGQTTIRRIGVEVTPQVALELNDLLDCVHGDIRVLVRKQTDAPLKGTGGVLTDKAMQALAEKRRAKD